jgi:hypothetical protein
MDIVVLVEQILGVQLSRGKSATEVSLFYGNGNVRYESDGDLAGFQFMVEGDYNIISRYIPEGWELVLSDEVILLYSLDGSSLNDCKLFDYEGELNIRSIITSDWYGSDISTSSIIIPKNYALLPAYPNPFNPITNINFTVPFDCDVSVEIYNIQGRKVTSLLSGNINAGSHSLTWDAMTHTSGLYFVKMASNEFTQFQKIILLK